MLDLSRKPVTRSIVMAPGGGTRTTRRKRDYSGVSRLGAPGSEGSAWRHMSLARRFVLLQLGTLIAYV